MKNLGYVFVCLGVLLGERGVWAMEPTTKPPQVDINALVVEYRLRVQAQGFVSDLTLFDDMGMLGRAVTMPLSASDSKETLVPNGGRDPESSGTSGILATPSVQLEMSGGLDPLLDMQVRIEALKKELDQVSHPLNTNQKIEKTEKNKR
ncbi:MAG: hypothetical protein ACO36I_14010 [Candidatus Latescibacterota bacterium]|jgi:hypothetical protein